MAKISGILKDPAGKPIPYGTIELQALKHTLQVIKTTTTEGGVDNCGFYSMDVAPNEYQVRIHMLGRPHIYAGNIHVYEDSPDGTLNSFLNEPTGEDLASENLKLFQGLTQQAVNASNEAKKYADSAEQVVSVPNITGIVRQEMKKTLYIDQKNGDDNNDGLKASSPLKTFHKAGSLIPAGAAATLQLIGDYTFDSNDGNAVFDCPNLVIKSHTGKVRIKFNGYSRDDRFYMASFLLKNSASIEFYNLELELPDVPSNHAPGMLYAYQAAVIQTDYQYLNSNPLTVRLSLIDIVVPEPERNGWHFIGNAEGMNMLYFYISTFPTAWRDRNKFFYRGYRPFTLFGRFITNSIEALSTDPTIYNDGSVKQ